MIEEGRGGREQGMVWGRQRVEKGWTIKSDASMGSRYIDEKEGEEGDGLERKE